MHCKSFRGIVRRSGGIKHSMHIRIANSCLLKNMHVSRWSRTEWQSHHHLPRVPNVWRAGGGRVPKRADVPYQRSQVRKLGAWSVLTYFGNGGTFLEHFITFFNIKNLISFKKCFHSVYHTMNI